MANTSRIYDTWSSIYDHTFGRIVEERQKRALRDLNCRSGQWVLDIGVGTGILLSHYPRDVNMVGLDLSPGMLRKAAGKKRELGLEHCHLIRGNAMLPPFADESFDNIIICHTISVVNDPACLLRWASRLLKPGGRIVLLNHFQSTHPVVGWFEKVLNPLFVKIGWRSDLALEDVLRSTTLQVEYRFKMSLLDVWQIVVLTPPQARGPGNPPTAGAAPELPQSRRALPVVQ